MIIVDQKGKEITDGAKVKIGYASVKTDTWVEAYYTIKLNPIKGLEAEFESFVKKDTSTENAPNIRNLKIYESGDFKLDIHQDKKYYLRIAKNEMHDISSDIEVVS